MVMLGPQVAVRVTGDAAGDAAAPGMARAAADRTATAASEILMVPPLLAGDAGYVTMNPSTSR
jgi:hypothetical protein